MRHFARILVATVAGASLACAANAGTSSGGTITIKATVVQTCGLSTGSGNTIDFGNYAGNDLTSSATITATCTLNAPYHIWIDGGGAGAANTSARRLSDGASGDVLTYQLYQDSGYSSVWGNTDASTNARTGTGSQETVTVYAKLPGGQNKPAGVYTDVVNTTISF